MTKRYIAHITIEAQTPLKVGSSSSDFLQDSPIQKDWNGLPMILGTSIAGVLRKDFKGEVSEIFGEDNGSKVIFSNALLLDENGKVCEDLLLEKSDFLKIFDTLPLREHTAITEKGVAKEHSKFDEEVVYKGTRFRFALEMLEEKEAFEKLIEILQSPSFRVGGGSTKGFGKFRVLELSQVELSTPEDLAKYSSSLNSLEAKTFDYIGVKSSSTHERYLLTVEPEDFFMFGSGFGDDDADQTPVLEKVLDYEKVKLSENHILIPATSLKGAIAHRTAYHYNLQNKLFVGDDKARLLISELFGEAKNSKKNIDGSKGKILFCDVYKLDRKDTKIFDHVAIDRFTAGAIAGALFQEKTTAQSDKWEIELMVEKDVDEQYIKAFEATLDDVCSGHLPLGGAVTKGHGVFSGKWSKS